MESQAKKINTIDQYIKTFPKDVAYRLQTIRELVHKISPNCEESISYNMPAFKLNKRIFVYFSGFTKHIGFYPYPSAVTAFKKEASKYKTGKGSIQFPLDKALPVPLITKILKFRLSEISKNKVLSKK